MHHIKHDITSGMMSGMGLVGAVGGDRSTARGGCNDGPEAKIPFRGRDFLVSGNPVYGNIGGAVVAISVAPSLTSPIPVSRRRRRISMPVVFRRQPTSVHGKGLTPMSGQGLRTANESAKRSETSISQKPRERSNINSGKFRAVWFVARVRASR